MTGLERREGEPMGGISIQLLEPEETLRIIKEHLAKPLEDEQYVFGEKGFLGYDFSSTEGLFSEISTSIGMSRASYKHPTDVFSLFTHIEYLPKDITWSTSEVSSLHVELRKRLREALIRGRDRKYKSRCLDKEPTHSSVFIFNPTEQIRLEIDLGCDQTIGLKPSNSSSHLSLGGQTTRSPQGCPFPIGTEEDFVRKLQIYRELMETALNAILRVKKVSQSGEILLSPPNHIHVSDYRYFSVLSNPKPNSVPVYNPYSEET